METLGCSRVQRAQQWCRSTVVPLIIWCGGRGGGDWGDAVMIWAMDGWCARERLQAQGSRGCELSWKKRNIPAVCCRVRLFNVTCGNPRVSSSSSLNTSLPSMTTSPRPPHCSSCTAVETLPQYYPPHRPAHCRCMQVCCHRNASYHYTTYLHSVVLTTDSIAFCLFPC